MDIKALYHRSLTRHQPYHADHLTYIRTLAQNDPLEWTPRIGGLPHDDARTQKSLEKRSATRRLRLHTCPTRPTAAAHALAPPLLIRTADASASRADASASLADARASLADARAPLAGPN